MRLSEAIVLGSTFVDLDPSNWYLKSTNCGCLIGMGYAAAGGKTSALSNDLLEFFPWLKTPLEKNKIPHLSITFDGSGFADDTPISIISKMAHLVYRGNMSIEQAVDWIRSVEPAEPADPAEVLAEVDEAVRPMSIYERYERCRPEVQG